MEWLENIRFLAPFKFYRNETRHITWRALAIREGHGLVVDVSLELDLSLLAKKKEKVLHFTGKVHLVPVRLDTKEVTTKAPKWNGSATVKAEDIYRVYFHGPSFQVLDGLNAAVKWFWVNFVPTCLL